MSASPLRRGIEIARREGVLATLRKAIRVPLARAKRRVWIDEGYVWYALDPTGELPDLPLPEGTSLRRTTADELEWLEPALGVRPKRARSYVERGDLPFVVEEDGKALFSCWIFLDAMPAFGWIPLPEGIAAIEHSHVAPSARGRGLGPAGALAAMRRVGEEGHATRVITKIQSSNEVSLRAFLKSGFHVVARMRATRLLNRWRVRVQQVDEGLPPEVVEALTR